jgi:endonuclease G
MARGRRFKARRWTTLALVASFAACSAAMARSPLRPAPPLAPPAPVASSPHVALGVPVDADPSDDLVMDRGAYVVSYNPRRNVASWVAWRLDENDLGHEHRTGDFRGDPALPAGVHRVVPSDYEGTGYDRGHLCPSGDRTRSRQDNAATFLMTNIHPQRPELNRHPWRDLEEYERALALQHHEVYIVAGGVFDPVPPALRGGVAIPRAEYKVLVAVEPGRGVDGVTERTRPVAVIIPNDPSVAERRWTDFATSVREIERATGYDFLTRVPPDIQRVIEARAP